LVSSGPFSIWKFQQERDWNGEKLSRRRKKIYQETGEAAYEKWQKEVYFPLLDARVKKLKANRFRKRA